MNVSLLVMVFGICPAGFYSGLEQMNTYLRDMNVRAMHPPIRDNVLPRVKSVTGMRGTLRIKVPVTA